MSPQLFVCMGGSRKTRRSYTDALRQTLGEALHDAVLGAARGETDRVRDRLAAAGAVRDHGQPAQAEQVGAPVGVRIEPPAEAARGRPDEGAAELAGRRRRDLLAQ